ncbi:cytochrome c oxidase subunit 3 [Litorivivens sp.]|uniref:cytochrome c oxidase subunit 3 n=1 Tax=Litorivivens sp. TaxID=2020868 RepID=UPI003562375B
MTISQVGQAPRTRADYLPGDHGMWFFIVGDLLIFGVYFLCYMVYRGQNLDVFLYSQQFLSQGIGVANTIVLLTSSLFVALATEAVREHKIRDAGRLLSLAIVLGALFPVLKMVEWIPKISAGHTPGENLFFMYYYVMTGLHLLHVLLGLCIMAFMLRNLRQAAQPDIKFIEIGAIYWHMVDVLWLVLLAVFYLMR